MEVGATEGGANMPAPLVLLLPLFVTVFVLLVSWLLSRESHVNVTKRRDVGLTNKTADSAARFEERTNGGLQTIAEEWENNGGVNNGGNSEHDKFANCHLRLTLTIKEVECVLPTQSTFKRQLLSGRGIENVARLESNDSRDFARSRDHSQDRQTTLGGKPDDFSVSKDALSVKHPQDFNLESQLTNSHWEKLQQGYKNDSQEATVPFETRTQRISEEELHWDVTVREQVCEKRRSSETDRHSRNPEFLVSHRHDTSTILQQVTVTNSQNIIREKSTFENRGNTNESNAFVRQHGSFEPRKTDDSLSGDDVIGVTGGCSNDLEKFAFPPEVYRHASNTEDLYERHHASVLFQSVVPSVTGDLTHRGKYDGRSEPLISNSLCTSPPNLSQEDREASRITSKTCLRDLSNARNMALKSILRNSPSKESLNKICDRGQKVTERTNKDGGRREVETAQVTAVHTIAGKRKENTATDSNLPEGSNTQTDHNHRKQQLSEETASAKTEPPLQVTSPESRINSNDNVQSQCSKEPRSSSRKLTNPSFLETEIPVGQDFYPVRDGTEGSTSLPGQEISSDKITIVGNSANTEHTTTGVTDTVRLGTYSDSLLSSATENPPISFIFVISKRRGSKQIAGGLNQPDGILSGHKNGQEKKDLELNRADVLDKEPGVKSGKGGGEGHSYRSCHGIKRTAEQKTDLQHGKHVLTRNTGAIIPAFASANMSPGFGNGTEGAINVRETQTQKPGLTFDSDPENPTVEGKAVKQGGNLNAENCGLQNNSEKGSQNPAKSVTFKLEREIAETTEGQNQRARFNGGIKNKSKDTMASDPGNGLELSEFESALTTLSENRHSAIPPNVGTVNSATIAGLDSVDSGLLESDGSNIKGKRRNMAGRKYPLQNSEARQGTEERGKDMPSFWQAYDLMLETDSDTTSTLSSPTFGSSTNASYGGSSSNSSSDFDVWKFDWALKNKKRERREDATARTLRKKDAIAETTDSSEDLEATLEKSGPDAQYKQTSKEVYLLTDRQTCKNGASTRISNKSAQINPGPRGGEREGEREVQGDLTGTDHLDDPMHGGTVTSSDTDTGNQYARGRAFALVSAGRPNGQQRTQNVRGDRTPSENSRTNFFDANFPNGRVFVALGTKGEVTRGVNGHTGSINDDLISREISVAGATSGGTTGRGQKGRGSPGRAGRYGSGERVSARGESANSGQETVNSPAITGSLPVITVTSDDEDRPQTNVIFFKDNDTSLDDINRCKDNNNLHSADGGLDITLTRSFWTKSCDPLPGSRKAVDQVKDWADKAGSLPDVRVVATVFSENFKRARQSEIANSVGALSPRSPSDLHQEKIGCEEGDTSSGRFPGSKGADAGDTCQNSRSGSDNTSGTVTRDRQHNFPRTQSDMVVFQGAVPRHGLSGEEERNSNNIRTDEQGRTGEERSQENGDVKHFGVEPMDKVPPRRPASAMEPRETGPFFRSETHIDIPAAKPLRRQDSLTKSSGIFFSSLDFVNKPAARSEAKITTGRATDLDTAMRRNREGEFNLISTYPGDRVVARSRVKGQGNADILRSQQRKARTPRSRSKSPNEVRVQEALRKLDLPGWYVNSDVAKVGTESPVLKRSRSADTTLSDSGVGTLPRQNQGEKMSSPTGEDPHPHPRKISPPSGQEPGPYRGRRQSREERLSEFYSQRKLHPYPNRRNSQDNREAQSPPVCNGAVAMVTAEDSSPEQNRRSTTAAEPDSRESTPEHSPKAAGDHENERFNTTWSSSEMSIDLPSSEGRPESAQPTLSPPVHRKTPPVITLSASPTSIRYAALTRSNPNLHELGKTDEQNVTITITETPRLDAPFTGMKDLENQHEDVSLEDMLDSLLALGSRRSSKSGSQSPNEVRRLSEDRLDNLVAETLPFGERRASDPGTANNQLEYTPNTTYDFAEALEALNTTSSSVDDTSLMNTTSSSLDTAVEAHTSSPKSLTSPFQTTSSFFETASSAAPDTTSGSFSASELRDMVTEELVTVRCSYSKCKRAAELKEARQSYKSCHNCYTYYCSRDCRKNHWERHKKKCVFSQINSACKHILQYARTNEEAQKCFSRVARTGYLSRGRGCVLLSFASLQDAQDFLSSGLPALPTLPGYRTFRELDSAQTEQKDPHTETLITMVTTYDPDVKLVLDVSIAVDTTNVKAHLVPRREGPTSGSVLSERHIVKKTREEKSDEPEGGTMILTSPPGSPEKLQLLSDRRSREICFINIQRNLRARGVILRHQYPDVYRKLCVYVEQNESFPPVTIYPRDTNTGKTFMCLIMPDSDPEILEWVQNPDLLEDIIA
ncbi:hypothetical protein Bbelb_040050 [Branchiostoma belcheri]|nr:hypothetical protein Bbelb_040050 [Branchiostoma belcheri]